MTVTTPQTNPPTWEEEALPLPGLAGPAPGAAAPRGTKPATASPRFSDVVNFVQRYLAPGTDTRLGGPVVWCPRWWEHPAAVMRLNALWRSWEVLRLQPGGVSTWWVQHYDPHMRALLDADRGPFYRCHKTHTPATALRTEAPPPDWRATPALSPEQGA